MSRPRINIKKEPFTPRDIINKDRYIFVLSLSAHVPKNAYLYIGGVTKRIIQLREVLFKVNELEKKIKNFDSIPTNDIYRLNELINKSKKMAIPNKLRLPRFDETPYIPGSSLKGAIRSRIEYKFKLTKEDDEYITYSCYIVEGAIFDESKIKNHLTFWGDDVKLSRGTCRPPNVCKVCDLFGTMSLSSRVHFSDAIATSSNTTYVNLEKVGNIEVFAYGTQFSLNVTINNADTLDLGLIMLGLELFSKSPILIGGFKYRFNPKAGRTPFNGKFIFGLLSFTLQSVNKYYYEGGILKKETISGQNAIQEARRYLENHEIQKYIDFERGVFKND